MTDTNERIHLRAGRLTLDYEDGKLRYLRLGDHEVVRNIYAAVRDQNWGTVPGTLSNLKIDRRDDSFDLTFTSDHQQGDIHFIWKGTITGTPHGTVTFRFEGEALTTFRRNRLGFCVLHPATAAGAACTIVHTDGGVEQNVFPTDIAPHQPFFDIRSITHEVAPGLRAEVRMEGDAFETEDQRNWTMPHSRPTARRSPSLFRSKWPTGRSSARRSPSARSGISRTSA